MENIRNQVEQVIRGRRSINFFKPEPPPPDLILQAIDVARWAPNHHLTEPWRFYVISDAVRKQIVELNASIVTQNKGEEAGQAKRERWGKIPGWLVVTCIRSKDPLREREDYAACCCAIQNLALYLWSREIGTKWTTGDVTRDSRFYDLIWVDPELERVVGLVWYGYAEEVPVSARKPVSDITIDI